MLARRSDDRLKQSDFALRTAERARRRLVLEPVFVSVDPYMRTRMHTEGYAYISRWHAGSELSGWTLARVAASRHHDWRIGDWAVGHMPMRTLIDHNGDGLTRVPGTASAPLACLHPLGMTGFTAWLGMHRVGAPGPDDTVLVSAAAGALGSIAAQIARRAGARVIVTAGTTVKRDWLRRIGFQHVLNHRASDFGERLARSAGHGLTLNFENIGGAVFAAANECMRPRSRIVLCGLISQYEQSQPRAAPPNLARLQHLGVRVQPFIASDHFADWSVFQQHMKHDLPALHWRLDIQPGGLGAVPEALIGLFRGDNLGKRVVYCRAC